MQEKWKEMQIYTGRFLEYNLLNDKSVTIQSNDAAVWIVIHDIQPLIMKTKDNIHIIKKHI